MQTAHDVLSLITAGAYSILALLTLRVWRTRRGSEAGWAAATFGALASVAIAGQFFPDDPTGPGWDVAVRILLALLVVFPYLLFRFAVSFQPARKVVEGVAAGLTALVVVWGFLLSSLPGPGEPRSTGFTLYIAGLVIQWAFLFVAVGVRLWRAGRGQPTLARRRMRLLALGAAGMALLIIVAGVAPSEDPGWLQIATQCASLLTALLFAIGFSPPRALRMAWRQPESLALQRAVADLMTVTTADEVAEVVLPPAGRILGARAAALLDRSGAVVASWGTTADQAAASLPRDRDAPFRLSMRSGELAVWIGPYTPFFGEEEMDLLRSLGGLVDLALERTVLFARERAFIANAAHELRTPLAALGGLSATLAGRWQQLSPEQLSQAIEAMERQGRRAADLVDRMLDLAFVEHTGVQLEAVNLAEAVKRSLETAPPPAASSVTVDVDGMLSVMAEAQRLEQVLVNVLANAYRYGGPHVDVAATARDGWVDLRVSDDGAGVAAELTEEIFEPFRRGAAGPGPGTGLGLAIARRMIEALGGSISYEQAEPRGACFTLRLRGSP